MDLTAVTDKFAAMGAGFCVEPPVNGWLPDGFGVNTRPDGFVLQVAPTAQLRDVQVLNLQAGRRHLVLMIRHERRDGMIAKPRFLCGHDEREWFVAGVDGVTTVDEAFNQLKPAMVHAREARVGVKPKNRNRRRNEAFVRQGEWFFLPAGGLSVDEALVLRREPLSRGFGKPHVAEYAYRTGGRVWYVCHRHPEGMSASDHARLVRDNPNARRWGWRQMRRDPAVYVRGRIRHPDHKTVKLREWHRVAMNQETRANVMFLD